MISNKESEISLAKENLGSVLSSGITNVFIKAAFDAIKPVTLSSSTKQLAMLTPSLFAVLM